MSDKNAPYSPARLSDVKLYPNRHTNCVNTMQGDDTLKIKYSKKALKFLAKQEKATVARIRAAIEKLTLDPPQGDIKEMQGSTAGRMRLRVGSFRVIYHYTEDGGFEILYIDEIGNRGDIYK